MMPHKKCSSSRQRTWTISRSSANGRFSSAPRYAWPRPGVALDPEELAELSRARPLLQEILDGMNDELRAVFILAEVEELSVREIAELLDVPQGTVSSRLRSAREKFHAGIKRLQARAAFAWRKR